MFKSYRKKYSEKNWQKNERRRFFFKYNAYHLFIKGYVPLLPIILIPGFASTSLKVEEGYNEWKDQRIWISLSKIGSQTLISNFEWKSERTIISTIKKQDESENDFELTSESTKKEEIEYSKKEINNKNLDENEEDNDNEMYLSLSQIIGKDNINEPDIIFRNRWLQHMSLQEDCCSDPPGIKVRPIPGNLITLFYYLIQN